MPRAGQATRRPKGRTPPPLAISPQKNLTFSTPLKYRDFFCGRQKKPPRRGVRVPGRLFAESEKKTP